MIISSKNLEFGLKWWIEKTPWGEEFVNDEYYDIYKIRAGRVDSDWLKLTVDRLWTWRAIRSPRPPNSKDEITRRGFHQIQAISIECERLFGISNSELSIEDVKWEDISGLYNLVLPIKCASHMFASKFCHFLFPKVFMVVDNLATGVIEYEFYWRGMKEEWSRCQEKDNLTRILENNIKSSRSLHLDYPFETKIIELSQIGYSQRDHRGDVELLLH
ncbi:MAG TPA: hypothetical protein VHZ52_18800 [Acidobacteriaceae bacterium]|jgi:hypothetical protein|nr:hypothetical protein [Acidobacteriaceae bacterium]